MRRERATLLRATYGMLFHVINHVPTHNVTAPFLFSSFFPRDHENPTVDFGIPEPEQRRGAIATAREKISRTTHGALSRRRACFFSRQRGCLDVECYKKARTRADELAQKPLAPPVRAGIMVGGDARLSWRRGDGAAATGSHPCGRRGALSHLRELG